MKTLAIIPAYNEEESIVATVEELKAVAAAVDYVVVNDGSRDATLARCREKGYNVLNLPVNVGLTAGFQAGMKYALEHGYDYAVQFDADGQHRPEYLEALVAEAERSGADIVIGSRFVTEKKPVSARMTGSALISGIVKATTGKKINDPTSGMRLYNRAMIERYAYESDFGPEPDTVAYLVRQGAKVSEVQVSMREREAGESYLSFSKSISYMARTCLSILFLQWFR
ncbi:glycosyltransferase [Eggerthellaceae bacterium zg-887]|uniref:glycosyltransferase family 2 protein n=1 Tax=Xiamenia xianingshaonis TaxID=2682776 RepID=UPI00140E170A|nr:glycosyltransferase family 2 protein [Xiamenia xianingshaonis]NHM16155.1 glycosyltransferase [Xiamenia xianingshaonis]